MSEEKTGVQFLLDAFERHGVKDIFFLTGGAVLDIGDLLFHDPRFKVWETATETGAAFAAVGYAKATGRTGVLLVTSGPGITNAVTGITDAHMDSVPLVIVSGQVDTNWIGLGAFQEAPATGITRAVTKKNCLVEATEDVPRIIDEAFCLAKTGRPGPVHIDFPKNLQQKRVKIPKCSEENHFDAASSLFDSDSFAQAVELLRTAEKPLLYVGGGAISADACGELYELATGLNIPVVVSLNAIGAFDPTSDLCLGMVGMHGTEAANYAMAEADMVAGVGARWHDRATGYFNFDGRKTLHIDIDPREFNKTTRADVHILGHAKPVLRKLCDELASEAPAIHATRAGWVGHLAEYKTSHPLRFDDQGLTVSEVNYRELLETLRQQAGPIKPQHVLLELRELAVELGIESKTVFTTGVGRQQMWAAQYLAVGPRRYVSSCGLGTMGAGLPMAVGAQVGMPDRVVIDIDGDRSFLMTLNELDTIARYGLAVKVIILNDEGHGMVIQWQDRHYGSRYSATSYHEHNPNFAAIAEQGHGIKSKTVREKKNLRAALRETLEHDGPAVLDVRVYRNEHVLPMIPAKQTYDGIVVPGDD